MKPLPDCKIRPRLATPSNVTLDPLTSGPQALSGIVLQIFCAKVDQSVGTFYMRDFRPFSTQIATYPNSIAWPPPLDFDDTLCESFVGRWAEEPAPPPG